VEKSDPERIVSERLTASEVGAILGDSITQPAAQVRALRKMGKEAAQALAGHKSAEMTAHYYEETTLQWVQPVRVK